MGESIHQPQQPGGNNFCLRWNDYTTSLKSAFSELRASESDLFDISLICEGSEVRAHRLILSACSGVLRRVIATSRGAACPTLLLWDISVLDMEALLTFMYEGEVNVAEAQLESFFRAAERLQVKGLTHPQATLHMQQPRPMKEEGERGRVVDSDFEEANGGGGGNNEFDDFDEEEGTGAAENVSAELGTEALNLDNSDNANALADETLGQDGLCNFCKKQFKTKSHARTHMADLHFPVATECPNCNKIFASRPKMMRHRSKMCKEPVWVSAGATGSSFTALPLPAGLPLVPAPMDDENNSIGSPEKAKKRRSTSTRSGRVSKQDGYEDASELKKKKGKKSPA